MASILTVDTMQGLTSGQINLPTGHKIKGTDVGSVYVPGMVIQVAQTKMGSVVTMSGTSEVTGYDVGLNVTITPKASTSKFYITTNIHSCCTDSYARTLAIRLFRNGVEVTGANGVSTGSRLGKWAKTHHNNTSNSTTIGSDDNHSEINWSASYLDSPATASSIVYSVRFDPQNGYTFALNRSRGYVDNGYVWASTPSCYVTVWEIAQ